MECYICHEPTTETSQCTCKAGVHAHCLLKSIQMADRRTCTICKGLIRNVRRRRERRLSRYVGCFAVLLGCVAFLGGLAALLLLALAAEEKRMNVFYDLIICCGTSTAIALLASSFLQKLLNHHDLIIGHTEYVYV